MNMLKYIKKQEQLNRKLRLKQKMMLDAYIDGFNCISYRKDKLRYLCDKLINKKYNRMEKLNEYLLSEFFIGFLSTFIFAGVMQIFFAIIFYLSPDTTIFAANILLISGLAFLLAPVLICFLSLWIIAGNVVREKREIKEIIAEIQEEEIDFLCKNN